ncbi:zinc-dependent metalloprotease [Calidifontimicrobium sp. SYSU G02091]|uniref:zinc-dependent metalloprotease n=1 Tax=Calidifontimicrobium sp. SYSU G02091 TaxID=2926421 RepID=UPI001F53E189|nr:zinc-dependent metalloprotease [Calidifontimicrobium sp. SYSU G02091]MCI1190726.1 zinc-dependent metalloprotease [Calidifontimicrobium sp. SYSU G02091]
MHSDSEPRRVTTRRRAGVPLALGAAVWLAGCAGLPQATGGRPTAAGAGTPMARAATAGTPAPSATTPAASAATAPSAAAPRSDPAPLRPFADVVRDAQRIDGFVPLWRRDERVWLEIAPERLNQPLLLSVNVASSVGERGLYAGQMGPVWLVEFRRVGNTLQLVARNTRFRADGDPALRRAVAQGFSESLIAYGAVASAAHPQRQSFLVDAAFLLSDLAGYATALERAFRIPYALDRGNSSFESVRADARVAVLHAKLHYATPRIPAPPASPAPGAVLPTPPSTTPDARSLFVGAVVSLMALPAQPMRPRAADPRVGHFTTTYSDFSRDLAADARVRLVNRWRLEKKDPAAPLSEPVQPIVFWIDRNVPPRYRGAVTDGVLEWNKAFERIGFRDAIVVRQQPDDAAFDTMDGAHASIRWLLGIDAGFARGPSHADPRTGEILDGDITITDAFGRGARRIFVEQVGGASSASGSDERLASLATQWQGAGASQACTYLLDAAADLHFALDLLEARGDVAPDGPEAEAFVRAVIKDVVTHEVGHVLGLTHNFRASSAVAHALLRDAAHTRAHGISASVMDYNPINLPLAGEPMAALVQGGLGAYDHWAIEYAYAPLSEADEQAALEAIAARGRDDPALAFGDDIDAAGLDPRVNRFDLGDDALAFVERRIALTHELWQRTQQRGWQPGDDPLRLRRTLLAGFRQLRELPALAAKHVGGMYAERDRPGDGRPAFRPVEPQRQRQALALLTDTLFRVDSFRFKPEFLASLPPDYAEFGAGRGGPVSIPQAVLQLQTSALDRLLDPGTAQRLLELPLYLPESERSTALSLHEVYATVQRAVWRELATGGEIDRLRRDLQREHLRRLQAALTRPLGLPSDALSLQRLLATELQRDLQRAVGRAAGLSVETRAHLADSLALLGEALRASFVRQQ